MLINNYYCSRQVSQILIIYTLTNFLLKMLSNKNLNYYLNIEISVVVIVLPENYNN